MELKIIKLHTLYSYNALSLFFSKLQSFCDHVFILRLQTTFILKEFNQWYCFFSSSTAQFNTYRKQIINTLSLTLCILLPLILTSIVDAKMKKKVWLLKGMQGLKNLILYITELVLRKLYTILSNPIYIRYSFFRASGYFGQRIISLVIEAVKHSPFYIWFSPPKDGRLVVVRGSDVTSEKRLYSCFSYQILAHWGNLS